VARPRVVVVTGEPGSGKSTLGAELARALRIPFIARDDVRGGLFLTEGAWSERLRALPGSDEAVEALLCLVETAAGRGVSCVVEYVVRQHRGNDLERLRAVADCIVLVTECRDARSRFVRRSLADRLLNRRAVLDALGYATIEDHTDDALARMARVRSEMRTQFDLATLHVRTDDGFEPSLDQIIEFVTAEPAPLRDAPPAR
jgi:predicted kinase